MLTGSAEEVKSITVTGDATENDRSPRGSIKDDLLEEEEAISAEQEDAELTFNLFKLTPRETTSELSPSSLEKQHDEDKEFFENLKTSVSQ